MPLPLHWEEGVVPQHREVMHTANTRFDFLSQALQRVYMIVPALSPLRQVLVAPLATGGAMAVYKLTVLVADASPYHLVCKIPHARRIIYTDETHDQTAGDSTHRLSPASSPWPTILHTMLLVSFRVVVGSGTGRQPRA